MTRLVLPLLVALLLAATAADAHRLVVFATVEGDDVTGYAFFVGGGRAQQTDWVANDAAGTEIANGKTGVDGSYRFKPPETVAAPVTVTLNTHEGHVSSATLGPERFGMAPAEESSAASAPAAAPAERTAQIDEAALARLVEAAVQRQILPLEEQIVALESRLRVTDILSGIFLIVGLAGAALYFRGRRR